MQSAFFLCEKVQGCQGGGAAGVVGGDCDVVAPPTGQPANGKLGRRVQARVHDDGAALAFNNLRKNIYFVYFISFPVSNQDISLAHINVLY